VSRARSRALVAAAIVAVLAVVGGTVALRTDGEPTVVTGSDDTLYEGGGRLLVLDGRAVVCVDTQVEYVVGPECLGTSVPVEGIDAGAVPSGVAWVEFTARLTSRALVVESYEEATPPSERPSRRRDPGAPCAASRAARGVPSQAELAAAVEAARGRPGFAGAWIERPGASGTEIVVEPTGRLDDATLVLGASADAAGVAAVADGWRGPLCVVSVPFSADALADVQRTASARECEQDFRDCVVSSSIDEPGNQVVVQTLAPSEVLDEAFGEELREGSMELVELLRPIG
jgi:hypothetical protein